MKPTERYHEKFQCVPVKLQYDFAAKIGGVIFAEGDCCDMGGCVDVFEAIDPEVSVIATFSGKEPDTTYRKTSAGWISVGG